MAENQIGQNIEGGQTVTAKASPDSASQITFPSANNTEEVVSIAFHGNHGNDLFLVQDAGDTPSDGGIPIKESTSVVVSGIGIKNGPQYLYASSDTSVDVSVVHGSVNADDFSQLVTDITDPVKIEAADQGGTYEELQAENLGTALGGAETALITYLAQALSSVANDEIRTELVTDSLPGNLDIDIAESSASPIGVDDSALGDETATNQEADSTVAATLLERINALIDVVNSGQGDDEVRVDLAADTLPSDVDVNDSALGDETATNQEADSAVAATLLERVNALIDVINSGQGDDEVRVDLAADTLSSDLDVNDGAIGDETTASQVASSASSATVIERLTALVDVLNSGAGDDELRVDLAADTLSGDLDVDDSALGDETNVVTQSSPGTNDNLLNYISGLLNELLTQGAALDSDGSDEWQVLEQEIPLYEDDTNELARVSGSALDTKTTGQTTTDSYADAATLQTRLTNASLSDPVGPSEVIAIVDNVGGGSNALDTRLRGRYSDGTDSSSWFDIEEQTNVSDGSGVVLGEADSKAGAFWEFRVQIKANSGGSQTDADVFIIAKGF